MMLMPGSMPQWQQWTILVFVILIFIAVIFAAYYYTNHSEFKRMAFAEFLNSAVNVKRGNKENPQLKTDEISTFFSSVMNDLATKEGGQSRKYAAYLDQLDNEGRIDFMEKQLNYLSRNMRLNDRIIMDRYFNKLKDRSVEIPGALSNWSEIEDSTNAGELAQNIVRCYINYLKADEEVEAMTPDLSDFNENYGKAKKYYEEISKNLKYFELSR